MWPKAVMGANEPGRFIFWDVVIVKTLVWDFGDCLFTWRSTF